MSEFESKPTNIVRSQIPGACISETPLQYALERDLISLLDKSLQQTTCSSIKGFFILMLRSFKSSLKNIYNRGRLSYSKNNDPISVSDVVFVTSLENNLQAYLPIAEKLNNKGLSLTFLFNNKDAKIWAAFAEAEKFGNIAFLEDYSAPLQRGHRKILQDWKAETREIAKKAGLSVIERSNYKAALSIKGKDFIKKYESIRLCFSVNRKAIVLGGRPKGVPTMAPLCAAEACGLMRVFVSHTVWSDYISDHYKLFDLRNYTAGVFFGHKCEKVASMKNPLLKTFVTGIPKTNYNSWSYALCNYKDIITAGIPAPVSHASFIEKIVSSCKAFNVRLIIKAHPPKGLTPELQEYRKPQYSSFVTVYEHQEITLSGFFSEIDMIICSETTVAYQAADNGIPVISYLSSHALERYLQQPNTIRADDVCILNATNESELKEAISYIKKYINSGKRGDLMSEQLSKSQKMFPEYNVEPTADFIYRNTSCHKKPRN